MQSSSRLKKYLRNLDPEKLNFLKFESLDQIKSSKLTLESNKYIENIWKNRNLENYGGSLPAKAAGAFFSALR